MATAVTKTFRQLRAESGTWVGVTIFCALLFHSAGSMMLLISGQMAERLSENMERANYYAFDSQMFYIMAAITAALAVRHIWLHVRDFRRRKPKPDTVAGPVIEPIPPAGKHEFTP